MFWCGCAAGIATAVALCVVSIFLVLLAGAFVTDCGERPLRQPPPLLGEWFEGVVGSCDDGTRRMGALYRDCLGRAADGGVEAWMACVRTA